MNITDLTEREKEFLAIIRTMTDDSETNVSATCKKY